MFDLSTEHPLLTLTRLSATLALPRILREAARIGLGQFVLEEPRTLAEIADHFGFDERVLGLFMDVLVAADVFVEEDGKYHASEFTEEIDAIDQLFVGMENWHCWSALDESLRTGAPAFKQLHGTDFFSYLAEHPAKNENWIHWNSVTSEEGFEGVVHKLPLRGDESICDIGGGRGELLCLLLDEFPDCAAALMERPGVELDEDTPFDWLVGDMFAEVPRGHDVYILSRVACNWGDKEFLAVLRNIAQAMDGDSRLFIIDGVMPEKGDARRAGLVANSLNLFLMFGSRIRMQGEYDSLLQEAGLELRSIEELGTDTDIGWSLLVATTQ